MSWLRKAEWPWWQAGLMLGLLNALGLVNLHIKPTVLAANVLGGLVFGAGMLLLGF